MAGAAGKLAVAAVVLASLATFAGIEAAAQPREDTAHQPAPPPAADPGDDALPERAAVRLGNTFFRDDRCGWAVAFSPDGSQIATMNYSGMVRFWDAASGRGQGAALLARGVDSTCRVMAISKDGKRLAAVGLSTGEQSFHLWDLPGRKEVPLADAPNLRSPIDFSPDGKLLAARVDNGSSVLVWDLEKGKLRFELKGHKQSVLAVVFSPDGKLLASAGGFDGPLDPRDTTIRLWDMTKGTLVAELEGHRAQVVSLAFSPDGKTLASASWDRTIRLWGVETHETVCKIPTADDLVAFSAEGKMLATGGLSSTSIHFWDPKTGQQLLAIDDCPWRTRSLCFSPDGNKLATVDETRAIRLWDTQTGKEIETSPGHRDPVLSVAFSPDGKTLASRSSDTTIRLWTLPTGKLQRTLQYEVHRGGPVAGTGDSGCAMAFSADGKRLIGLSGGVGPPVEAFYVWDVASGDRTSDFRADRFGSYSSSVALAPDGDTVATASRWGVFLWSLASRKLLKDFILRPVKPQEHGQPTDDERCAVFSPDARTLAAFDAVDHVVRLWDWKSGVHLREIPVDAKFVDCLAFSPDGQLLAGCNPGPACVWETATGKLLRKLGEDREGAHCVAFAPDGRRLVVATKASADVWDVLTGDELSARDGKPLLAGGHKGDILCAAFSPDGKTIASGSADTTILLWDAHDLQPQTPAANLAPKDLDRLWDDLKSDDAPTAYKAILALIGTPDKATVLLKDRVSPAPKPDAQKVKDLLAQLDSNDLAERDAASGELARIGEAVEPALREALAGKPSAEVRARCERLLEALGRGSIDADGLRRLRAVQVLEHAGTPEARTILKALANGAPGALSRDAKVALDLLDRP